MDKLCRVLTIILLSLIQIPFLFFSCYKGNTDTGTSTRKLKISRPQSLYTPLPQLGRRVTFQSLWPCFDQSMTVAKFAFHRPALYQPHQPLYFFKYGKNIELTTSTSNSTSSNQKHSGFPIPLLSPTFKITICDNPSPKPR